MLAGGVYKKENDKIVFERVSNSSFLKLLVAKSTLQNYAFNFILLRAKLIIISICIFISPKISKSIFLTGGAGAGAGGGGGGGGALLIGITIQAANAIA